MPLQRFNSTKDQTSEIDMSICSPKDKKTLHDVLDQLQVASMTKGATAGKLAADKWRSLTAKEIYDDFCQDTSFTALTRIHKAAQWYKQVIWLLAFLFMVTWLIIQCYWLFLKYYSYPVEVKLEVKATSNLEFPSVTICNVNPLRKSQMSGDAFVNVSKYFQLDDTDMLYDAYLSQLKKIWVADNMTHDTNDTNFMNNYMQNQSYNKWAMLENDTATATEFYQQMDSAFLATFMYSTAAVKLDDVDLKKYGHQKENLIVSCSWQGSACSPSNFTYFRNNLYGNCYTINAFDNGMASLSTNYAGPLMGLILELNIEQDEYVPALAPDAGVRIIVHKRGIYPIPEDKGINIPTGFKTSISMKKKDITRLPPPHSDCGSNGDGIRDMYADAYKTDYSKHTCMKSCIQQNLISGCACASSLFYFPRGMKVCGGDTNSSICMTSVLFAVLDTCNTKCPSQCSETTYDLFMSMSTWPSEQYSGHLNAKIKKTMSDFMNDTRLKNSASTLAKVEIYFKELTYESMEQTKSYESESLISDIGGQLGLWLGLSAITMGEIVEFLASIMRLAMDRVIRKTALLKKEQRSTQVLPELA